ncbi:aminomethyltransferase [Vulcanimicrobium alpinum]|uniref:Aminomethyltransferase n=1 Tax=Vulcanimicrobium alpinum TaxID=3016050 RepID=A0AAN1XW57_UNVUL|nr:glycine cleavage system aminomethyltransferase GcvT [Vulcanimicrobium alpinum]BDE05348.1 aminomethyltransferase [Vulcanimicrobium alpinum]
MSTDVDGILRRTALFDAHLALGGRMVPFGGFDMPVQYAGILKEHDAVRKRAGLFDLSHMGQFELRGASVGEWADALTINKVATMKPGQARYNVFTNERGGAHDDVIFYRLADERWLLVVNAANADKMWAHVGAERSGDVQLTDLRGERALIAIQGPRSVEWLQPFVGVELAPMKYYACAEAAVRGSRTPAVIARTGYTGEDGFELFLPASDAVAVWDTLLSEYRAHGLEPCGLGARDVLRLEAGMPLYGHEMDEEITPLQAGLAWAIKFDKPAFRGKAALEAQRDGGDFSRIAGLSMQGRVPARAGYPVLLDGAPVGEIRSGSWGPSVQKNIATALVSAPAATAGTRLAVEVRGTAHVASVEPLPFYRRPKI